MLQRSDRIEDADEMLWELSLVLLLAWMLTYICVIKGIKSSGKVSESGIKSSGKVRESGIRSSGKVREPGIMSSGKVRESGIRSSGKVRRPGFRSSGKVGKPDIRSSGIWLLGKMRQNLGKISKFVYKIQ